MVKSYEEAKRKLATSTKFVPVHVRRSEVEAVSPIGRLHTYRFIPEYVSPFILDSIPVYDTSALWVGEEVRAAELRGDLPDRSYSVYKDWLNGIRGKKLRKVYSWAYITIRKKLRVFLLKILTQHDGIEGDEDLEYNGYIPGR